MTALAAAPAKDVRWQMHSAQYEVFASDARTKVVAAGRRGGKSETGVMWIGAGARDDALLGIPGVSWVVAPTYKLLRPLWRKFVATLPREWITGRSGTERMPDYLELEPMRIEFRSADHPDTLVAEGVRRLWVDECGRIKEDAWAESLLPTTIDNKAPALLTGTPKGRNWFHRMFLRGKDPLEPDIETFHWTSFANPFIEAPEVQRMAREMSARKYRQEILAEFLDDEGAVFRGVRACVGPLSQERTAVLGVDLAKHEDFTVLHGLDAQGRTTRWERFNQISWPLQKERIIAVARSVYDTDEHRIHVVLDSTGVGDPILDDLRAAGLKVTGYKFTAPSKQQLVEALTIAIEQRRLTLPDEPELLNELEVFEYATGRTGHTSYSAPEGLHDDCVMALGLAWQGLHGTARKTGLKIFVPGANIEFTPPKELAARREARRSRRPVVTAAAGFGVREGPAVLPDEDEP